MGTHHSLTRKPHTFSLSIFNFFPFSIFPPRLDGYEVTRQVRQSEAGTNAHIPIIAITANAGT